MLTPFSTLNFQLKLCLIYSYYWEMRSLSRPKDKWKKMKLKFFGFCFFTMRMKYAKETEAFKGIVWIFWGSKGGSDLVKNRCPGHNNTLEKTLYQQKTTI